MSTNLPIRWIGALSAVGALVLVSALHSSSASTAAPTAPQVVSFAVMSSDPLVAQGIHPADILGAGGTPVIFCADLGLVCADPTTGVLDQIGGLSFGQEFYAVGLLPMQFSVAQGTRGAPGTAVRVEADCNPPEPQADVFGTALDGANTQIFDGNGVACGGNSGLPLYLQEGNPSSSVHALVGDPCLYVDPNCDGLPEVPVFLTLAAGSPTLTAIGATPADILLAHSAFTPLAWARGTADLGLVTGDALDAICIKENGNGAYDSGDVVLFSLAPGSPSLAARALSPADIMLPGQPATPLYRAAALGLQATDNVNGLMCSFEALAQIYLPLIQRNPP